MKIDKHGLCIKGLKKASGATQDYAAYSGEHDQIGYDRSSGVVIVKHHYNHGAYSVYPDPDIVHICHTDKHMTMQEIADLIYAVMGQR